MFFQATGKVPRRIKREKNDGVTESVRRILQESVKKHEIPGKLELPEEFIPLTLPPRGKSARLCYKYLRGRGLSDATIEACQIGYARKGRFAGMAIFPSFTDNQLCFFTSRAFSPLARNRVLHASVPRGGLVFNYNNALQAKRVLVNEGPFDAWAWRPKMGVGVAVLNHSLHVMQARLLATLPAEEFIFCYDATEPESTLKDAMKMSKYTDAKVSYILLETGDPSSERRRLKAPFRSREKVSLKALVRSKLSS